MKITQVLKEAAQISAAFAFGRFNPAHQGHIAVWRTVENAAARWYIGTNPSTLGPNDPLTFEQKSAWMAEIYPPISGHIAAEQSVMTLAAKIFTDLGKNETATIAYITDADDWAWSGKLLNQYNGKAGAHGYYKFAEIVHVPSPRVSSATALRDAARADDKVAFYHASGTDPKLKVAGKTYFDTVKEAVTKYPLPVKKVKKVAEGAPIVVAQAPIDVRNPKKDQPKQRYMGDIVPDTKPPSTEKRGVKGRAGQRPMPTYEEEVEEASLATMRDYFAGDENAKDPTKLSQMRDFFNKHKPEGKVIHKNFNSKASYEAWLRQQNMKKIGEDEEAGEVEKTGTLIPFPKGTTKVDVEGEYDWYKLGQVISDLDDADPAQFGTGPASAMIAFGSEAEEHKYLPLLKRLGMRLHDIDQPTEGVEIIPVAEFVTNHLNKTESKFTDYELAVMEGGHSLPEAEKIAGRYDPAEFDSMVQRLGKIAKAGPMKTIWDPVKQVYKTVPDTDKQKKIAEAVIKVVEVIKQRNGLWKK